MAQQDDNPLPTQFRVPFISRDVWLSVFCNNLSIKTPASPPLPLILAWKELHCHGWARFVLPQSQQYQQFVLTPEDKSPLHPPKTHKDRGGKGLSLWNRELERVATSSRANKVTDELRQLQMLLQHFTRKGSFVSQDEEFVLSLCLLWGLCGSSAGVPGNCSSLPAGSHLVVNQPEVHGTGRLHGNPTTLKWRGFIFFLCLSGKLMLRKTAYWSQFLH